MSIIYDIIYSILSLLYFPYLLIKGKWHRGFFLRFGQFLKFLHADLTRTSNIWIHAVSVGEIVAVLDLIRRLKSAYPQYQIVVSTVTKTGYRIARDKLQHGELVLYAPLDFSWVVKTFVAVINPKVYIAAETELWPNLYRTLNKRGIPIVQINGRISDRAFAGYKRFQYFTRKILDCVSVFCMQSPLDAQRVIECGANPNKVRVTGNIKFDSLPEAQAVSLENLGYTEHISLLVAGSTHPGEEDILIDLYRTLSEEFGGARLVLCPRHIERAEDIVKRVNQKGYRAVKWTQLDHKRPLTKNHILIVDAIGQLTKFYRLAKIVYVGKSLTVGGGQNMIEPASLGKPVIVGPLTSNFKDVMRVFLNEKAIVQVQNAGELLTRARSLLNDPKQADDLGHRAQAVVRQYQGSSLKIVQAIEAFL